MGQLTVVRHGQASMHAADYDRLSTLGVEQSRRLGAAWRDRDVGFDAVYSGPARRHLGTCAAVREAWMDADPVWTEPRVLPGLDEHDAFALVRAAAPRLRTDPEIGPLVEQVEAAASADPGARSVAFQRLFEAVMARWLVSDLELDAAIEPWPAFAERVEGAIQGMLEGDGESRRIVAFTSVGPLAVMLRRALGTTDLRSFQTAWRLRNASVTTFVFGRGRFTLDSFNVVEHLADPAHHTFR
jgi:broad specificity phosphatase PhoE